MEAEAFRERTFTSHEGLAIYFRDYGDALAPSIPTLCLTGLTRNSQDFHALTRRLAEGRRVLCLDFRGRGRSAYDPSPHNYTSRTYVRDVLDLLSATQVDRVVAIGTAMGGLVVAAIAVTRPAALAGVVLNDVGPEIDPTGVKQICSYVGKAAPSRDWDEGARDLKQLFAVAYPDLSDSRWHDLAASTFRPDADGMLCLNCDLAIARGLCNADAKSADLWNLYRALVRVLTLAIRGELSDVLSEETFDRIAELKPDLIRVTAANRGHAPLLNEPECIAAIESLFDDL